MHEYEYASESYLNTMRVACRYTIVREITPNTFKTVLSILSSVNLNKSLFTNSNLITLRDLPNSRNIDDDVP